LIAEGQVGFVTSTEAKIASMVERMVEQTLENRPARNGSKGHSTAPNSA